MTASDTVDPSGTVLVSTPADGVRLVTLHRPKRRNALTRVMLRLLQDTFETLAREAASGDVRAVVLTGADPAFCAGLDLNEMAELGPPPVSEFDPVSAIAGCGVPVIGAINGPAATGGLEVALACDFRIAGERAAFADTHSRVGVVPGWGLTARLPIAVGFGWARQMSATGNYVDAALALRIGLVNEVVAPEELLPRALQLATDTAGVAASVLASIRGMYDAGARRGADAAHAAEAAVWAAGGDAIALADVAERRAAVLERGRAQR